MAAATQVSTRGSRFWLPLLVAASIATFAVGVATGFGLPRTTTAGGGSFESTAGGVAPNNMSDARWRVPAAAAATTHSPDAVVAWNAIAMNAAAGVAKQYQVQSLIYVSLAQAAVYDAAVAIDGGYRPYKLHLGRHPHASFEAAVSMAAHDVLGHYFPAQQAALDADLAASLGGIPEGRDKSDGIALGQASAAGIIALRAGDGLEADIGFVVPSPAPGVWTGPLVAGAKVEPQTPWISRLRPFLLDRPDQFLPPPPPALRSDAWATEYNETKLMGSKTSTVRTAEQTTIAQFYSTNAMVMYNTAFKALVASRGLDGVAAARLYAMGDLIGADAGIACFNAKYHYLFWRPIFAIEGGDTDGNPATIGDPAWLPLLTTPNHPEYPGAHGCDTSAVGEAIAGFLGTDQINLDLTSTVTPTMPSRHFDTVGQLEREIVNARVWGGIHFRGSAEAGVALGHAVAQWSLQRYFQPKGNSGDSEDDD